MYGTAKAPVFSTSMDEFSTRRLTNMRLVESNGKKEWTRICARSATFGQRCQRCIGTGGETHIDVVIGRHGRPRLVTALQMVLTRHSVGAHWARSTRFIVRQGLGRPRECDIGSSRSLHCNGLTKVNYASMHALRKCRNGSKHGLPCRTQAASG